MASEVPTISEWFSQRNIFITGATGFMGKVLVYKLLLSCRDLGNVFLLLREKKGVDPQSRLHLMMEQEPFKTLKEKYPERIKKIILVTGDTTVENLGLSSSDKERLLREVSVVFHMAANVKFDLTLKQATKINTQGTMNVLALAKQMPYLKSFIHVSTTYCHCNETVLEERAYHSTMPAEKVMASINEMSDEALDTMTTKILGEQPNTYAFSKGLSEDLVQRSGLPAGVARPSIVTASLREPMPGWVENLNGPTGLMIGAGKGVIRTFLCNYEYSLSIIPCDMAINAVIALAWKVGIERPVQPIFMNVTSGKENPISWGCVIETGRKHIVTNPFTGVLWYPGGSITSSKLYHWFRVIFYHLVPAYLLDALFTLTGNKPFLVKVQQRVSAGLELLQYYTTKEWIFRNDRMKALQQQLTPSDRKEFFMDTKELCWDDYILTYMLGTRKYCLKDDPSTLPRARKVLMYLYYIDWFIKIALFIFAAWMMYTWIMPFKEVTTTPFDIDEI